MSERVNSSSPMMATLYHSGAKRDEHVLAVKVTGEAEGPRPLTLTDGDGLRADFFESPSMTSKPQYRVEAWLSASQAETALAGGLYVEDDSGERTPVELTGHSFSVYHSAHEDDWRAASWDARVENQCHRCDPTLKEMHVAEPTIKASDEVKRSYPRYR